MKIYDCFMYFDEDLLLNLRLNILYDYVDQFIILEAEEDHQGNKRKLNFDIKKFKKFSKKIKYIPLKKINIDPSIKIKKNWDPGHLRDQSMRNSFKEYLNDAQPDDWIIISDLDEIPNPKKINDFKSSDKYAFFKQNFYYYKFNIINKSQPYWFGSRICVKKHLKSPQWLRNIKIKKYSFFKKFFLNKNYKVIEDGGWHFSFIKSPERIIKKINSFCHGEFNKNEFKDIEKIEKKIFELKDIFDRPIEYAKVEVDNSYPKYFLQNIEKYKSWLV